MSDDQEQQSQLAKEASEEKMMAVDTAFVVFVQDGVAYATNDLGTLEISMQGQKVKLEPMRRSTPDDLYRYASEVAKDVQVSQTAEAVVQATMQVSQQLAQQAQAQEIAKQTGVGGSGGLHVPRR